MTDPDHTAPGATALTNEAVSQAARRLLEHTADAIVLDPASTLALLATEAENQKWTWDQGQPTASTPPDNARILATARYALGLALALRPEAALAADDAAREIRLERRARRAHPAILTHAADLINLLDIAL